MNAKSSPRSPLKPARPSGRNRADRVDRIHPRSGIGAAGLIVLLALLAGLMPVSPAAAVNPNRVVALTPFSANAMARMGAFPAAVGQTLGGDRRLVSGLRSTPVLKLSHPSGPNPEELALYAPKLVFSSPQWSRGRSMMESLGGRVVNADPTTVNGVYSKTRQIAALVGAKARGKRLVTTIKRQVARARKGIRKKPRVMVILGVGRTPFVFLPNSWGGQLVRLAGGQLITGGASSSGGFARIGDDVVADRRPDVIIAVPHAEEENIPAAIQYLKTNPAWASTPAARKGRIFVSTDNSLLQAGTDIGRTITKIRKQYLKNG